MAVFEKLSSPSLKDMFVDKIAEMILSGALAVGEKFPPERALAEQMGVGKTVVHSGFQELQRMGFVTVRPQSGVYVADYMSDGNLDTFNALFRYNGDRMSLELIRAVFDFRLAVEGFGLRRLAERHTAADIALLRRGIDSICEYVSADGMSYGVLRKMFYDFHVQLLRMSGCFMTTLCFNAVEESVIEIEERYIRSVGIGSAIDRLTAFVDAVERGDGDAAEALLKTGMDEQYARYEWARDNIR